MGILSFERGNVRLAWTSSPPNLLIQQGLAFLFRVLHSRIVQLRIFPWGGSRALLLLRFRLASNFDHYRLGTPSWHTPGVNLQLDDAVPSWMGTFLHDIRRLMETRVGYSL